MGGAGKVERIAGRADGFRSGQRVVLFAKSGTWWVQPFSNRPFTGIRNDSTWEGTTHLGTEYAALLVDASYSPPKTTDSLPAVGKGVIAIATTQGKMGAPSAQQLVPERISFSGYEWEILQIPSDSGGVMHENRASNVWTDARGALHLRIAREASDWTCAEVILQRSLGYGTYSFRVKEMPRLEPGTVLAMFTWDELEAGQNHRELDVELSQWGDPQSKNGQFTVQPYYVPPNVYRFNYPSPPLTYSFRWEPRRAAFLAAQETSAKPSHVIAQHVFTSGIPSPGGERVHINLYIYGKSRTPQQKGVEVVLEKFEFLP